MPKVEAPYEQSQEIDKPVYSEEELKYRSYLIEKMTNSRDEREGNHLEFDERSYSENYEANFKTGNSYLRPKKNKNDTRIVTGTTLEKENTFLSQILNYNFEPDIDVHDKEDLLIYGLGEKIESLVKKSFLMEDYESKRPLIYKEGADQGTWFAEDIWVEEDEIVKSVKGFDYSSGKVEIKKIKIESKRKRRIVGCRVNLLAGTNVYLGNVKQFFIDKQPHAFTRDVIDYSEAKACYGGYDRFSAVPKSLKNEWSLDNADRDWTLENVTENKVERIKFYDPWANEYMLMLNGVMMLPVGFPLTEVSPSGRIPLAKGDIEPISEFFAYSKSFPAKTRVDQEILDDTLRTFVVKLRQLLKPPMVNNTNQVLTERIFDAGSMIQNANPNQLVQLLPNNQISAGEFQVFQLIKQIVDEKTMNPIMSGQQSQQSKTATEAIELKKQSLMKLGYAVYGILSFERQLTWLRAYNILANWTKAIDSGVDEVKGEIAELFRTVSVPEEDQYGKFTRVIKFDESGVAKSPEQLDAEAKIMSTLKNPVQVVYMNPKLLRERMLETKFYINIFPTEKETSELRATLYTQRLAQANALFPGELNKEYAKKRLASYWKEDPDEMWSKQPQMAQGMAGAGNSPVGMGTLDGMKPKSPSTPSVNTLANA